MFEFICLPQSQESHSEPFRVARTERKNHPATHGQGSILRWRIPELRLPLEARFFLCCNPSQDYWSQQCIPRFLQTRSLKKSFAAGKIRKIVFENRRVRFDRIPGCGHNSLYVNPVEGRQARRRHAGYKDGAKIYFCYRRCCFLTGKRRSSLLDWLSPRKSRFQSHPAEMRPVPERGSRYDETVSARRSLWHRRRGGDRPRSRPLRALHPRQTFPRQ